MKRLKPPAHERWKAVRDPAGQWIVVNERGEQPLRSQEPMVRLQAAHQAAAAPALVAALQFLVEGYRRLMSEYGFSDVRHRYRLTFAECVLVDAKAPVGEIEAVHQPQQELDLAA